jgi:inosine/xanthosine triphosphatase
MARVVVASTNPVKVQAAVNGFRRMFPDTDLDVVTVAVPSGVGHQPFSDEETLQGALNRVQGAAALIPEADYWVGIEGGIEEVKEDMAAFAWIVVHSKQFVGKSRTGTFFLPRAVADLIRQGKELGEADDIVFNRYNSKQENGAVGILTGNVVERMGLYEQAMILALIPFRNELLYGV